LQYGNAPPVLHDAGICNADIAYFSQQPATAAQRMRIAGERMRVAGKCMRLAGMFCFGSLLI